MPQMNQGSGNRGGGDQRGLEGRSERWIALAEYEIEVEIGRVVGAIRMDEFEGHDELNKARKARVWIAGSATTASRAIPLHRRRSSSPSISVYIFSRRQRSGSEIYSVGCLISST